MEAVRRLWKRLSRALGAVHIRRGRMVRAEGVKAFLVRHLIGLPIACCVAVGIAVEMLRALDGGFFSILLAGSFVGVFVLHPAVLTILNLLFLFRPSQDKLISKKGRQIEHLTLELGCAYTWLLYLSIDIQQADWSQALYEGSRHLPIWSHAQATVAVLLLIGLCGYLFLSRVPVRRVPPLVSVCAISAMYLGLAMCVLWTVQVIGPEFWRIYLCLFPFNCMVIGVKTVRDCVTEWKCGTSQEKGNGFRGRFLNWLDRRLMRAERWPAAAFLLAWPLLGFIICILVLFGQRPDSAVRAWTETADWNLSARVPPPSIPYNGHYLCTVAAGGHRKVVKPIRMGERHGRRVVVNRQLCIANAFEQVVEERAPAFHLCLRRFYDAYGLPISRLIYSPYAADVVYILMKPLEWMFLMVLYFHDVNPENRIAAQYMPRQASGSVQRRIGPNAAGR